MNLSETYRAAVKRADVEAAEKLSAIAQRKSPHLGEDTCVENRRAALEATERVYEQTGAVGKALFVIVHSIRRMHLFSDIKLFHGD